jgi:hypothetical protein
MEDLLRSAGIDPGDDGLDARPGDDSQDHSSDDEDNFTGFDDNDAGSSRTESTPISITSPQSSVSDTIKPPKPFKPPAFIQSETGEPIYYGKMTLIFHDYKLLTLYKALLRAITFYPGTVSSLFETKLVKPTGRELFYPNPAGMVHQTTGERIYLPIYSHVRFIGHSRPGPKSSRYWKPILKH